MDGWYPAPCNDAMDIPTHPDATQMMRQSQWILIPQYSPEYFMSTLKRTSNTTWNKDFALSVERKDIKHISVLTGRNNPSKQINVIRKEPLVLHLADCHSSNTPICQSVLKALRSLINLRWATLMHASHL